MKYGLHLTCCINHMQDMPAGVVNLMIVDSPYANTDLPFDKQPVDWAAWWMEAKRVLAPNGMVVCFAAELFTHDLVASNRSWYRYKMVWAKSRASRILDAAWRPLCNHEDLVVFAPVAKGTYNPQRLQTNRNVGRVKRKDDAMQHYKAQRGGEYNDTGLREPTTVLDFGSVPTMSPHFNPTAKPVALVQYLVLTYSNPGDLVFEPFAGDAPTAHACENTGRRYIGCEVNLEQYEWSRAHLARKAPLFIP